MGLSDSKRKQAIKMINTYLKSHKAEESKYIKIGFLADDPELGKIQKLSTGLIAIDVLTDGGFVKGHINQVFGGESCGKTTTFFNLLAHCQKTMDDFLPAYLPAEKSLDRVYAQACGVEDEDLLIMEGETAENNTDFCIDCANPDNGVDLLIIDTLQALSSKGELYKGKGDTTRSTEDNSMALLPRVYSQFLRMYTSRSVGKLTLILASQVRTDLSNPMFAFDKQTGGNAIAHYNLLTIKMTRVADSNWPWTVDNKTMPPNSFVVKLALSKAKIMNRYKNNSINMYFHKGQFEHRLNVLAIAKDLGLTDGKSLKYRCPTNSTFVSNPANELSAEPIGDIEKEFKARGFKEMYEKAPDEAITWLESQLKDAYTKKVMDGIDTAEQTEEIVPDESNE